MKTKLTILATLLLASTTLLAAQDTTADDRMLRWADDLLSAKRELLRQAGEAYTFKPVSTLTIKLGQEPQSISVDVSGIDNLVLQTDAKGKMDRLPVVIGDPVLTGLDGKRIPLSSLTPANAKLLTGRFSTDKDLSGKPLSVKGKTYAAGVQFRTDIDVVFKLDGKFKMLDLQAGADVFKNKSNVPVKLKFNDRFRQDAEQRLDKITEVYPELATVTSGLGMEWIFDRGSARELAFLGTTLKQLNESGRQFSENAGKLSQAPDSKAILSQIAELNSFSNAFKLRKMQLDLVNPESLGRALMDLAKEHPGTFPDLARLEAEVKALPARIAALKQDFTAQSANAIADYEKIYGLQREILLRNPVLDFDKILLIKRLVRPVQTVQGSLGFPVNYMGTSDIPGTGWDNQIATLEYRKKDAEPACIFKPAKTEFICDMNLHFDADRMLLSMPNEKKIWQVFELKTDGTGLRQVISDIGNDNDIHNYDACYLPSGKIIYTSTAPMVSVPCLGGGSKVANIFLFNPADNSRRQLCFDQEHNWCPRVMNDGRVLYLRWEYSDIPHSNSRRLFTMNPDGTGQLAYYGSNSYWPNGVFFAKPIPNHPTKVVGIVTGHHGSPRMGEMVIFDPAKGTAEADGVVQRIPGFGKKVEPVVADALVDRSWPKFLHPYPLSDKYFLVSCKPTPDAQWGVYLVDIFDNLLPLKEIPGQALFEPVPLRKQSVPPVISERVDLKRDDAVVYIQNIYYGPGLKGIPKGTVKSLRILSYTFSYHGTGGLHGVLGIDGPWDIKRVLGVVPVYEDGSASFRIPANRPVALQPLDKDGKALQIMRSWFVGMPGETVSCVGCHENRNDTPMPNASVASTQTPMDLSTWCEDKTYGFSFANEIQPVLDKYCIGCHDGSKQAKGGIDLRGDVMIKDYSSKHPGNGSYIEGIAGKFSIAYADLYSFVRGSGIESDMRLLTPMEFHADSTALMQMLRKGHSNVTLDKASMEKLITWIDVNRPYHGTWSAVVGDTAVQKEGRRAELRKRYANVDENHEEKPKAGERQHVVMPGKRNEPDKTVPSLQGWPLAADAAQAEQAKLGGTSKEIDLGAGIKMVFRRIPAGSFVMGSNAGHRDELPQTVVRIEKPFWIGEAEVSNRQYVQFDATHDSRREDRHGYQFGQLCYQANEPDQPAVRVAWREAKAFCDWLSQKARARAVLPSEAQWEYACRAGSATPFSFGAVDADYTKHANLGDQRLAEFACDPYRYRVPIPNSSRYDAYIPRDDRFNDGGFISEPVKKYQPNPWGLYDTHGNVWEWTRSEYRPYPYKAEDGRESDTIGAERVARGGSWFDRPKIATASYRLPYCDYQRVYNVGFRVVLEE